MLSTGLGLVFGAWFGFRVRHSPRFYTRQGQIKDDVERTLRYWHADKKLLRFVRYAADKHGFRPGQFRSKKGGISSNSSHVHGASWCIMVHDACLCGRSDEGLKRFESWTARVPFNHPRSSHDSSTGLQVEPVRGFLISMTMTRPDVGCNFSHVLAILPCFVTCLPCSMHSAFSSSHCSVQDEEASQTSCLHS